jgi:hypothetical protein
LYSSIGIAPACDRGVAVNALGADDVSAVVQQATEVDGRVGKCRIGGNGLLVSVNGRLEVGRFKRGRFVEPRLRVARCTPLDHARRAVRGIGFELEEVTVRIPPATARRLRARRHGRRPRRWRGPTAASHRQPLLELADRARDAPCRNVRVDQRLRSAQHDEVLEREAPCASRAARRRHEACVDQRADGAARQAQQALDIVHAVTF